MAMDDLVKRIRASIENADGDLWFPELTADLAARAWDGLRRDIGLTPYNYGTERVMCRSPFAPRDIIASLKTISSFGETTPAIAIEALKHESAVRYQEKGVRFYSPDEILHTAVLACIEDAIAVITEVPSLARTVAALVRCLHVIKPENEDYDVSFSEPNLPFSIFVSVPQERISNSELRVAEAIVHEAMHLQLTFIEQIVQLVLCDSEEYFSPWRGEHRPAQGILHGLYVFAVIDSFIANLQARSAMPPKSGSYSRRRRGQIDKQMREVAAFRCGEAPTELGKRFIKRLW